MRSRVESRRPFYPQISFSMISPQVLSFVSTTSALFSPPTAGQVQVCRFLEFPPLPFTIDQLPFTCSHSCSRANYRGSARSSMAYHSCAGLRDSDQKQEAQWFFMLLFQVPAVLLWGQPVQSPGCSSGWILQTANSSKCVLFIGIPPMCLSVDSFTHSFMNLGYTVLPDFVLRALCF